MRICKNNGWITNVFPIEVECRGFITNSTSMFLTNFGFSPSDKRKYIKKIQDKTLTALAWIWQSHSDANPTKSGGIMSYCWGCSGLVVMMLWPWNHTWTESHHHLMKVSLEVMLYKTSVISWCLFCGE